MHATTTARRRKGRGGGKRPTITAKELVRCGVPHATIQSWLRAGVLTRTAKRGVYVTTAATEERLAAHRARRARA